MLKNKPAYSERPRFISIPRHQDLRGNLSVVDFHGCLPFEVKRVFYVYDIPAETQRGGHAHKTLYQFIWSVSGTIVVSTVDTNNNKEDWLLQVPWKGLLIPPMFWASEKAVSAGCVYIVAASDYYDESDYIRDIDTFYKSTAE